MPNNENSGSLKDKFDGFGAEPTSDLWDSIYDSMDGSKGSLTLSFEGFGAEPSIGLWDAIAARLDEKDRRRIIWWWWSGAAAAIFVIGLGLNYSGLLDSNAADPVKNDFVIQTDDKLNDGKIIGSDSDDNTDGKQNGPSDFNTAADQSVDQLVDNNNNGIQENSNGTNQKSNEDQNEQLVEHEVLPQDQEDQNDIDREIVGIPALLEPLPLSVTDLLDQRITASQNLPLPLEIKKFRENRAWWEIGVEYEYWTAVGGGSKSELFFGSNYAPPSTGGVTNTADPNESFSGINSVEADMAYNSQPAILGDVRKPLNLNFTADYNFNRRLALETGLNFSRHFYRTAYNTGSVAYTFSAINTLGIPLGVRWNFIDRSKFQMFAATQAMAELPITAKNEEVAATSLNTLDEENKMNGLTNGLLLSSQLNLGMRFQVNDRMLLHTSFGTRYYMYQRINNTAPLQRENLWMGGAIGVSWRL